MGEVALPVPLGEVVDLQRGTTYKSALLGLPGPVLLGLASIARNGGFRSDSLKTYGGESPDKLVLRPGDLYVSLKDVTQAGDLLGAVSRVPKTVPLGRLTQDTVKLAFKSSLVPPDYLYWLLRSPAYRDYCRARAIGTTNLSLSRDDFLAFPVPLPLPRHMTLVETLGALDDKIELNRRMSETLEATARALFKSWFVDADPIRSVERPGESHTGTFLDVARLLSGGTPKTDRADYWDGEILWASAKDVSQCRGSFLVDTERKITRSGLAESHTQMVPALGSVVVARGATTGRLALLGEAMAMNQTCYALESRDGTPLWLYLQLDHSMGDLTQAAHGSVFDTITTATFAAFRFRLPSEASRRAFEDRVAPILGRARACAHEVRTLAAIRDALLPKLISGQLRLREADAAMAVAVP